MMNQYHSWIKSREIKSKEEPWWVTQCLDWGQCDESEKGSLKSFLKKISKMRRKISRKKKHDDIGEETKQVYNEILSTIKINSPKVSCKVADSSKQPKSILRKQTRKFESYGYGSYDENFYLR